MSDNKVRKRIYRRRKSKRCAYSGCETMLKNIKNNFCYRHNKHCYKKKKIKKDKNAILNALHHENMLLHDTYYYSNYKSCNNINTNQYNTTQINDYFNLSEIKLLELTHLNNEAHIRKLTEIINQTTIKKIDIWDCVDWSICGDKTNI